MSRDVDISMLTVRTEEGTVRACRGVRSPSARARRTRATRITRETTTTTRTLNVTTPGTHQTITAKTTRATHRRSTARVASLTRTVKRTAGNARRSVLSSTRDTAAPALCLRAKSPKTDTPLMTGLVDHPPEKEFMKKRARGIQTVTEAGQRTGIGADYCDKL